MDLASPGADVGRVPNARLYRIASIAGALLAAIAFAYAWNAGRQSLAPALAGLAVGGRVGGVARG